MNVTITPSRLSGTVSPPPSKSLLHRFLIALALCHDFPNTAAPGLSASDETLAKMSEDIRATFNALTTLRSFLSKASQENSRPSTLSIFCGESGSTLRFFMPIAAALTDNVAFFGQGRLPERPVTPLKKAMSLRGCTFSKEGGEMFNIRGPLLPGEFSLAGDLSSQYFTGLLFALPLLYGPSRIVAETPLESQGYIDMTLYVLGKFGIDVQVSLDKRVFYVTGGQRYKVPADLKASMDLQPADNLAALLPYVEGDWSNAAFWLVADASANRHLGLSSAISVGGLRDNSRQGDRRIKEILELFQFAPEGEQIEINVAQIPDLVPILGVLASLYPVRTSIVSAQRIRTKESDRLATTAAMINNLGGRAEELPGGLIIRGSSLPLAGGGVNAHNDHRIAMAAAAASCFCQNQVTIFGAQAVNKSYPEFWQDFQALGGQLTYSDERVQV